jgi:molybdopterin molybdotransferase
LDGQDRFERRCTVTVKKRLADLESWFSEHAPKAKEVLLPGASTDDIASLENTVGAPVPTELRTVFDAHDGQQPRSFVSTIEGCMLLSCKRAGKAWSTLAELLDAGDLDQAAESRDGKVKAVWWSKKWIPFAESSGDLLCVDLDPPSNGRVGQVVRFYHDEGWREQLAPSVDALLANYLQKLRHGRYKLTGTGGIQPT